MLPRGFMSLTDDAAFRMAKAIGSENSLLLYVGDWLSHLNLFSDAQLYDILRFVKPVMDHITSLPSTTAETPLLFVTGYRWVGISGLDRLWDANLAEACDSCPQRAVTHISCDIIALRLFAQQQEGVHDELARKTSPPVPVQDVGTDEPASGAESSSAG